MEERKFDYVLFDLDGTLTDSERGIVNCIAPALESIGVKDFTPLDLKKMIGPPFRVSMKTFYGFEGDIVEDMLKVYRMHYDDWGWRDIDVYEGIFELLKKLKSAGFTLAVATSKPIRFTKKIIEEFGFTPYFSYIGAAADDGLKDRKSIVIEDVLKNLKVADRSRVVMVGDTIYDIIGAREASVKSIGILWGYGKEADLRDEKADFILSSPQAVGDFLLDNCQ